MIARAQVAPSAIAQARVRCMQLFLLASLCVANSAFAHLLPAQNATLNIIGDAAFCVVSVPTSALQGVDDDADGLLQPAEIQRHNLEIVRQFEARFRVTDGKTPGKTALSWIVPVQADETTDDASYLVMMHRVNFPQAISKPIITTDLFGSKPSEQQITVTATRDFASLAQKNAAALNPPAAQTPAVASVPEVNREVAILRPGVETHQFFRGAWASFVDFFCLGIEHILSGFDHLLFLLTLFVVAGGWHYWLGVITSFTIAHSITLSLAAFNVVHVPSSIVEPSIAASLVLMALLNLRSMRLRTAATSQLVQSAIAEAKTAQFATPQRWWDSLWARVIIVFACGLLHGFGFASAIGALSLERTSQLATLAGFNLGIELGQLAFVITALLLMRLVQKLGLDAVVTRLPKVAAYVAIVCGSWFFLERIGVL